ncbi:hypothetical protein ABW21_db0206928 [Orbilia brochopaga]|nr:hypothetical protein ABW21_db0206928 [Drechslerella brochopaga]
MTGIGTNGAAPPPSRECHVSPTRCETYTASQMARFVELHGLVREVISADMDTHVSSRLFLDHNIDNTHGSVGAPSRSGINAWKPQQYFHFGLLTSPQSWRQGFGTVLTERREGAGPRTWLAVRVRAG